MIYIKYGGRIKPSFNIYSPDTYEATNTWERGNVLTLNDDGELIKADANSDGVKGLACECRQNAYNDETKGNGKGSMILDECLFITDELASGVSFDVGDALYVDADGKITNTGTYKIGVSLGYDATSGQLTALFSVTY